MLDSIARYVYALGFSFGLAPQSQSQGQRRADKIGDWALKNPSSIHPSIVHGMAVCVGSGSGHGQRAMAGVCRAAAAAAAAPARWFSVRRAQPQHGH